MPGEWRIRPASETVYFDARGQPSSRRRVTNFASISPRYANNGTTAFSRIRHAQNAAGVVMPRYLNDAQNLSFTLDELEALHASSFKADIGAGR